MGRPKGKQVEDYIRVICIDCFRLAATDPLGNVLLRCLECQARRYPFKCVDCLDVGVTTQDSRCSDCNIVYLAMLRDGKITQTGKHIKIKPEKVRKPRKNKPRQPSKD